jgi:hypothetical protein
MMVLRRLFIHRFLSVPLQVQLHALRFRCSVSLSMINLRDPVYSPEGVEGKFSELRLYGVLERSLCPGPTLSSVLIYTAGSTPPYVRNR